MLPGGSSCSQWGFRSCKQQRAKAGRQKRGYFMAQRYVVPSIYQDISDQSQGYFAFRFTCQECYWSVDTKPIRSSVSTATNIMDIGVGLLGGFWGRAAEAGSRYMVPNGIPNRLMLCKRPGVKFNTNSTCAPNAIVRFVCAASIPSSISVQVPVVRQTCEPMGRNSSIK